MNHPTPANELLPEVSTESLSFWTKFFYGIGYVPDVIMNNLIGTFAMMIYNVEYGVPATWLGIAIALPRIWEAFTDPLIGNLSDNTRTRWGRRRPFIVGGVIAASILAAVMWMPPRGWGHEGLLSFFLVISILYFTAYAFFNVPYLALGLELSTNDSDRTSLMGFRAAAVPLAYIAIMPWAPVLVTNRSFGSSPAESMRIVGILLAVVILVLGLLAAFVCKEKVVLVTSDKEGVVEGFKNCLKNKPFLMVTGIVAFTIIGFCVATSLVYYINLSVVFPGGTLADKEAATRLNGICQTVSNVIGLCFCPLVNPLAKKIGRQRLLLCGIFGLMIAFISSPLLFSHQYPYLQIIFQTLVTVSVSCVWVLTIPMLGDVCDFDEIQTGKRREGLFTAMFNWGGKAAISAFSLILGIIIDLSHFKPDLPMQSAQTVKILLLACSVFPIPFLALCAYFTIRFPLSPEKIKDLR